MINWLKSVCVLFLFGCSCIVNAATIPSDALGAQKYESLTCVADTKANCINSMCLNSSQRNCQGNCEKMAYQKCREQKNE